MAVPVLAGIGLHRHFWPDRRGDLIRMVIGVAAPALYAISLFVTYRSHRDCLDSLGAHVAILLAPAVALVFPTFFFRWARFRPDWLWFVAIVVATAASFLGWATAFLGAEIASSCVG